MPFFVFLINSLITLHTDCRIDILASPSFYTITFTSGKKFLSLGLMHSMTVYKIFKVIPTILGLLSLSILIKLGKMVLIDDWTSCLSMLDWILNSSSSAASVFYLMEPSRTTFPKNFDWIGSYLIIDVFLFSFLIEFLIFYSLRWVLLCVGLIFMVSMSFYAGCSYFGISGFMTLIYYS